jgi:hypothetical protein
MIVCGVPKLRPRRFWSVDHDLEDPIWILDYPKMKSSSYDEEWSILLNNDQ